jgi:hypothetical protein
MVILKLYFLDKDNKITLMTPYDSRYIGLDMSNLPDFKGNEEKKSLFISRPFISLVQVSQQFI